MPGGGQVEVSVGHEFHLLLHSLLIRQNFVIQLHAGQMPRTARKMRASILREDPGRESIGAGAGGKLFTITSEKL